MEKVLEMLKYELAFHNSFVQSENNDPRLSHGRLFLLKFTFE